MPKSVVTVNERSAQPFLVNVTDMNKDPVVPLAFKWHLTDLVGNVINSRLNVAVTPASSVTITVYGDDTAIIDSTKKLEYRLLTIETDMGDVNLPQTIEICFSVLNLTKIS